jgi:predicted ATP-grasp superfamily ATP-dependent carboligase
MKRPVLILGGADNTLAIARSLTRYGVPVGVSTESHQSVRWSRFYRKGYFAPSDIPIQDHWAQLLLEQKAEQGAVILTCSDEAVQFVAMNFERLGGSYILEENRPDMQLKLLDKRQTLILARDFGLDVPWHHWDADLSDSALREAHFPVLVKPIHSHLYSKVFRRKLRLVNDAAELKQHLKEVDDAGLQVMLCELIPGEDDLLCSYYTYIDANGNCLFDFTKKIIRRVPKQFGIGCYHATEWLPDVAEVGRKFFTSIGYRGLANIEFKRDPRDGKLKVMESNPRFTAAHQLLIAAGMDTARIVYDVLSGAKPTIPESFAEGKRLLYPFDDFIGFLQRRSDGEMSFRQWLASVAHPQEFPQFAWLDPLPAAVGAARRLKRAVGNRFG